MAAYLITASGAKPPNSKGCTSSACRDWTYVAGSVECKDNADAKRLCRTLEQMVPGIMVSCQPLQSAADPLAFVAANLNHLKQRAFDKSHNVMPEVVVTMSAIYLYRHATRAESEAGLAPDGFILATGESNPLAADGILIVKMGEAEAVAERIRRETALIPRVVDGLAFGGERLERLLTEGVQKLRIVDSQVP